MEKWKSKEKVQRAGSRPDECVDCLEALRDTNIRTDQALIQEARELASIFAKSVSTAKKNTRRRKDIPNN